MSERALVRAALACLLVGGFLLFVVDAALARLAGVLILTAFIALGTFAIASPARLSGDDPPEDEDGA
ncbi:MAG: hypothetical protein AB7V62_06730 [Thermoleophilia bacterium]